MQISFVLTVLSDDQPGLVRTLSDVINEYAGSWTDSRMIHLEGKFAGLLKISVAEDQADGGHVLQAVIAVGGIV